MNYKEVTAAEAVLDFERRIWPALFVGNRTPYNREYKWAHAIIKSARAGKVSAGRARRLLERYGEGKYRIETTFQVEVETEAPSQDFSQEGAL